MEAFSDPKVKGVTLYLSDFARPVADKLMNGDIFSGKAHRYLLPQRGVSSFCLCIGALGCLFVVMYLAAKSGVFLHTIVCTWAPSGYRALPNVTYTVAAQRLDRSLSVLFSLDTNPRCAAKAR